MEVKSKSSGTHQGETAKTFQMRLQGELLYQLEKYASDIGVTPSEAVRHLVESELVRKRYLPEWWYTRVKRIRP